jgi:hypothetical protein
VSLRCRPDTTKLRSRLNWRLYARVQSVSWADSGFSGTWSIQKAQAEPFLVDSGNCMPGDPISILLPYILRTPHWLHIVTDNGAGESCVSNIVGIP